MSATKSFHSSSPGAKAAALFLSVAFLITLTSGANKDDYKKLLEDLTTTYSPDVRPIADDARTTEIYLGLQVLSIVEVNEKAQTLKTNALMTMEWTDDYLSWDPTQYNNISTILLRQKYLWLPDIVVSNTVTSQTELGYKNLKLRINAEGGDVSWNPSGVFETACDIDVTYYPFDTQVCNIIFKTAMSIKHEIYVYIDRSTPVDLSTYSPNGLWDLMDTSAENLDQDGGETNSRIRFRFQLQRRRSFYLLNIILPIFFLSLTSSLTFALPAEAGEKMGLSITVLLAYAVYLTIVTDAMPDTSVQVSVLTVYLVVLLAVTSASVVLSVVILRFHHRPPSSTVTGCLATITLALRKALRMPSVQPNKAEERGHGVGMQSEERDGRSLNGIKLEGSHTPELSGDGPLVNRHSKNSVSPQLGAKGEAGLGSNTSLRARGFKGSALSGPEMAETWDRFIFLLFTAISLSSTVACFIILLVGAERQENSTSLRV